MGWYFKSLIPFHLSIFVNVAAGLKLNGVKDKKIKLNCHFLITTTRNNDFSKFFNQYNNSLQIN